MLGQRAPIFKGSPAEVCALKMSCLHPALKMWLLLSQQPQFLCSCLHLSKDIQRLTAAEVMSKRLCLSSQAAHLGLRPLPLQPHAWLLPCTYPQF